MIIYKTVQKVISQDNQQKMQFLEYKTTSTYCFDHVTCHVILLKISKSANWWRIFTLLINHRMSVFDLNLNHLPCYVWNDLP